MAKAITDYTLDGNGTLTTFVGKEVHNVMYNVDNLMEVQMHISEQNNELFNNHLKTRIKYKLKKSRFLDWMFSDFDDQKYWGTYFLNELKKNGKIEYNVEQMLDERDELPMYIMEGYDTMCDEMVYDINQIKLID